MVGTEEKEDEYDGRSGDHAILPGGQGRKQKARICLQFSNVLLFLDSAVPKPLKIVRVKRKKSSLGCRGQGSQKNQDGCKDHIENTGFKRNKQK